MLQHFLTNIQALHDVVVLIHVRHVPVSSVLPEERLLIQPLTGFAGYAAAAVVLQAFLSLDLVTAHLLRTGLSVLQAACRQRSFGRFRLAGLTGLGCSMRVTARLGTVSSAIQCLPCCWAAPGAALAEFQAAE